MASRQPLQELDGLPRRETAVPDSRAPPSLDLTFQKSVRTHVSSEGASGEESLLGEEEAPAKEEAVEEEHTLLPAVGDENNKNAQTHLGSIQEWQSDLVARPPTIDHEAFNSWYEAVRESPPVKRMGFGGLRDNFEMEIRYMDYNHRDWDKAWAMLACQFDKSVPPHLRAPKQIYDPRAADWAAPLLACSANDMEAMRGVRHAVNELAIRLSFSYVQGGAEVSELVEDFLDNIILYLLHADPFRALTVDIAFDRGPGRRRKSMDVLLLGVSHFAYHPERYTDKPFVESALQMLERLRSYRPSGIPSRRLTTRTNRAIRLLLVRCNTSQAIQLFKTLTTRNVGLVIRYQTFIHFSYRFAKDRLFSHALSALRVAISCGAPVDSDPVLSTCNVILRMLMAETDGYQSSLNVVSTLLEMNIPLTTALTAVLILNAVEADDLPTAIGLYDVSIQNNVEANSVTFDLILRGLRKSDDADLIERVVNDASEYIRRIGPSTDSYYVANAILSCLGAYHMRQSCWKSYDALTRVYYQYFNAQPLIRLGILPQQTQSKESIQGQVVCSIDPDVATMHIMMHSYLHSADLATSRPWVIWKALNAVAKTDPFLAQCLGSEHFYSSFIQALGHHRSTLHLCGAIFQDMTTEGFEASSGSGEVTHVVERPEPSVHVMNALLGAFVRNRAWEPARRVKAFMRERNIPRTGFTWNTIIGMHSRRQDEESAAKALRQMELEGWQITDYTMGALRGIRDRERLQRSLERTEGQALRTVDADESTAAEEQSESMAPMLKNGTTQLPPIYKPDGGGGSHGYTIDEPDGLKKRLDRSLRRPKPAKYAIIGDDDPFNNPVYPPTWNKDTQAIPKKGLQDQETSRHESKQQGRISRDAAILESGLESGDVASNSQGLVNWRIDSPPTTADQVANPGQIRGTDPQSSESAGSVTEDESSKVKVWSQKSWFDPFTPTKDGRESADTNRSLQPGDSWDSDAWGANAKGDREKETRPSSNDLAEKSEGVHEGPHEYDSHLPTVDSGNESEEWDTLYPMSQ